MAEENCSGKCGMMQGFVAAMQAVASEVMSSFADSAAVEPAAATAPPKAVAFGGRKAATVAIFAGVVVVLPPATEELAC